MDVEHIMRMFTWNSSTNISISSVQEKDPTYLSEFTFEFLVLECTLYCFLHVILLFNLLKETWKIMAQESGNTICSFHWHVSLIEESCPEKKKERNINVFYDQNWHMRQLVYNKIGILTHSSKVKIKIKIA